MLTIDELKKIIEKAKTEKVYIIKSRTRSTGHIIKIGEELKLIKIEETASLYGRGIKIITLTEEYKKLLKLTD